MTGIGFVAAFALALPAGAAAAETGPVIPPGNSAATQYTEAVPTARGDSTSGGGHRKTSPAKVLGSRNAHKLESQGRVGREVARVVTETAPETSAPSATAPPDKAQRSGSGSGGKAGGGDGNSPGQTHRPRPVEPSPAGSPGATTDLPSGSSGLGEIVAEATGSSSSGELGALLPLAILAAIAWALAFFWRQRRPAD